MHTHTYLGVPTQIQAFCGRVQLCRSGKVKLLNLRIMLLGLFFSPSISRSPPSLVSEVGTSCWRVLVTG